MRPAAMPTDPRPSDFWSAEVQRFLPDPRSALQDALDYVCCPLCSVLAGVPFEYFVALPARWQEEPELRRVVSRAGGFCNRHAWKLFSMQSLAAIAAVFLEVLQARPELHVPGTACPVCRLQQLIEQAILEHFLGWLEAPENRDLYSDLFGLCDRHQQALLDRTADDDLQSFLVRCQERCRQELVQALQGFLEKRDGPAKWTRSDEEKRAPRWALLRTAGNEEAWV
jgi:hypothetical protein